LPDNQSNSAAIAHNCRNEADMSKHKYTILYCRLSRDDGSDAQESNSIGNQKRMLIEYAERNGFTPF
jgi:hypothetical protein